MDFQFDHPASLTLRNAIREAKDAQLKAALHYLCGYLDSASRSNHPIPPDSINSLRADLILQLIGNPEVHMFAKENLDTAKIPIVLQPHEQSPLPPTPGS